MPSLVNINGVFRESKPLVNINGVWRDSNSLVNVNGVWREASILERSVTVEDIKSFEFAYFPNKKIKHPDFSWLEYNEKVPAFLDITGDISGEVNLNEKGVELQYDRNDVIHEVIVENKEEGIKMYESHIYAILQDDTPIDICCINSTQEQSSIGINKITDLKIEIQATLIYEANGYYMAGWNNICSKNQFTITTEPPRSPGKSFKYLNNYVLLPVKDRDENYQPLMQIGIARDLTNDGDNMVGSYGVLDHTIHWISVNGEKKPFVIKKY